MQQLRLQLIAIPWGSPITDISWQIQFFGWPISYSKHYSKRQHKLNDPIEEVPSSKSSANSLIGPSILFSWMEIFIAFTFIKINFQILNKTIVIGNRNVWIVLNHEEPDWSTNFEKAISNYHFDKYPGNISKWYQFGIINKTKNIIEARKRDYFGTFLGQRRFMSFNVEA